MSIARSSGLIAQIKCIIGVLICLVSIFSGISARTDANVKFEITSQLTTQSNKLEFEITNNGSQAISRYTYIEKFEKKENDEWVETQFERWEIDAIKYTFINSYIFPNETWKGSISLSYLFPNNESLTAGQYRITFGVKYLSKIDDDNLDIDLTYSTCEFTIEQA